MWPSNAIRPYEHAKRLLPTRVRSTIRVIYRDVQQRLHNPTQQSRPVFLVGCGRSGTTMLVDQLARSWEVDRYNEDHPLAFVKWRLRDLSTIRALVQQSRAKIVVFKPILDTHLASRLLDQFPDAKLIFIFRHYHDVIHSSLRRFGTDNWRNRVRRWIQEDFAEFSAQPPPAQARQRIYTYWQPELSSESAIALYWLFYNSLYYDLELHNNPRVRLVRYESIVSSPHPEFLALCQYLSIKYSPKMIQGVSSASIAREAQPAMDENIRAECERLWQTLSQDRYSNGEAAESTAPAVSVA